MKKLILLFFAICTQVFGDVIFVNGPLVAEAAATPVWGNIGTPLGLTTSGNVSWPSHSTNDIGVLVHVARGVDTPELPIPAGWTELISIESGAGNNSIDARLQLFFKTAASGSEASVALSGLNPRSVSQIFTVTGASSAALLGSGSEDSATASVDIATASTSGASRLVVGVLGSNGGSDEDQISSWTNANLSNVTDRAMGRSEYFGAILAIELFSGELASSGAVGSTTATLASAQNWAAAYIEFAP